MLTQKKLLSLEELEDQMMVELPPRELMHAHKHGSYYSGTTTITETINNCTNGTTVNFSCNNFNVW
jgi:hypothetical protein